MANRNHTTKVEVKAITSPLILRKTPAPSPAVPAQGRLFNIINESGKILRHHCKLDDAHRLMHLKTRDPVANPEWQGDLRVKAVIQGAQILGLPPRTVLTYEHGLPSATVGEVDQPLRMYSDSVSFADDFEVSIICGECSCDITLELALANLDRFAEPGRSRLEQLAGLYYGVQLVRKRTVSTLTYADGLPMLLQGTCPTLRLTGTNLGLGGGEPVVVNVACGTWSASITVELALLHLDDFVDVHRARLVGVIGAHFGIQLLRGAA